MAPRPLSPLPFGAINPSIRPPPPMPRYARPGGYPAGHTGKEMSIWDNIGSALSRPGVSDMLMDLGYGLTTGKNFGEGLANATQRMGQMQPYRDARDDHAKQLEDAIKIRESYARNILSMGGDDPMFRQIADAVSVGGMEPADGWGTAMKLQTESRNKAEELRKSQANAAFLKDPILKEMVASGALPFKEAYAVERGEKPTDDIEEFLFAKEQGFDGDFMEYRAQMAASGGGGYGQTVMLGQGPDGPVPLRADPSGGLSVAPLPPGITFDPGGIAGARTTAVVDAKTAGAARSALPGAELGYEIASKAVNDILADKTGQAENFGNTLGIPNQRTLTWPGSPKANFWTQIEQLSGQAFLQIRQALKGAGQVTDYEGMKGEQALSRMRDAATNGDQIAFQAAVIDFKAAIDRGMELLREQAAGGYAEGAPAVQNGTPGSLGGSPPPGSMPPTAVNPQTGEKLVLQNGQWVPVQ